jgi:Zn finger protein HypA/HybF involved in hydrogenase expression
MQCVHCGEPAEYKTKGGKPICKPSANQCPTVRKKNSVGLKAAYESGNRVDGKTAYDSFPENSKSNMAWAKGKTIVTDSRVKGSSVEQVFSENSTTSAAQIRNLVIKEKLLDNTKCTLCPQENLWNGLPLTLHLDHINGNRCDNRLENLRFLCPNCHSQTITFCNKSYSGKKKVEDSVLIEALLSEKSVRAALLKVGLKDGAGNYGRAYRLLSSGNVLKKKISKISSNSALDNEDKVV